MNLCCGINAMENKWSGMFMSYPLLLLPYVVYNYIKLQQIPQLFKSTVSVFIFQYYFYLTMYFVHKFAVFGVGLALAFKKQPSPALRMVLDVLDQLQILTLIVSIYLGEKQIKRLRSVYSTRRNTGVTESLLTG